MPSLCKKIQTLKFCKCPELSVFDNLPTEVLPSYRPSPLDKLGFCFKCCWVVPLRPAAIIICFIMLMWSILQVVGAEKTTATLITDKESNVFYFIKITFVWLATMFIMACGVLLVGIILSNHKLVNIFMWYTVIYTMLLCALSLTAFGLHVMRTGKTSGKLVLRLVLSVLWNCLVFYFLKIINSYKMLIWMP